MRVLLDTHVLLWWKAGGSRLSKGATHELARADTVLLSPVSFWEVSTLVERNRIALDRPLFVWIRDLQEDERVEIAPVSAQAAAEAGLLSGLGFDGDPADQMLYATATEFVVPLVSRDSRIRDFAWATKDVRWSDRCASDPGA